MLLMEFFVDGFSSWMLHTQTSWERRKFYITPPANPIYDVGELPPEDLPVEAFFCPPVGFNCPVFTLQTKFGQKWGYAQPE